MTVTNFLLGYIARIFPHLVACSVHRLAIHILSRLESAQSAWQDQSDQGDSVRPRAH